MNTVNVFDGKRCRACLQQSTHRMHSLLVDNVQIDGIEHTLGEIYCQCTRLPFDQDESSLLWVCQDCYEKLVSFFQFRNMCIDSYNELQEDFTRTQNDESCSMDSAGDGTPKIEQFETDNDFGSDNDDEENDTLEDDKGINVKWITHDDKKDTNDSGSEYYESVFEQLEATHKKTYNEKFPPCIKAILEDTGYSTKSSLMKLQEETIKTIEDYLTSNKSVLNHLTCCYSDVYKKMDDFHFLPGHKAIILSLPNDVEQLKMFNELTTNKRTIKQKTTQANEEENKRMKKRVKKRGRKKIKKRCKYSDAELKQKLVELMIATSRRGNFQLPEGTITDANIIEFERFPEDDENVCTCKFSCPFCSKLTKLIFKTYWMSSNATKHLKSHIQSNLPIMES